MDFDVREVAGTILALVDAVAREFFSGSRGFIVWLFDLRAFSFIERF